VPGASYALALILTKILQGRWFYPLPASFVFSNDSSEFQNVKQLAQSRYTTLNIQAEILSMQCFDRLL